MGRGRGIASGWIRENVLELSRSGVAAGADDPRRPSNRQRSMAENFSAHRMDPRAGATGVVLIDLARIAANWRALAALVRPAECAAVVKADAYGLGAARIIPTLLRAGCRTFFVATAKEALEARELAPEAVIYVLNGLIPGSADRLIAARARPVLGSLPEVQEWASLRPADGRRHLAGLHLDTGLNRLGLSTDELNRLVANYSLFSTLNLGLVLSHLACADDPTDTRNATQLVAFSRLKNRLPHGPASLAASDGLMLGSAYHFDLVRPGYAIYGGQAALGRKTPVEPAVIARAVILQVREVSAGDTIGYSATFRAEKPMRIATVAAGYADGIPRSANSTSEKPGGRVSIAGQLAPIVGRVSMDLITVDVSAFAERDARRGTFVDLVGPNLPIDLVGQQAGTIGYEVLTRLGRRFPRVYVGESVDPLNEG